MYFYKKKFLYKIPTNTGSSETTREAFLTYIVCFKEHITFFISFYFLNTIRNIFIQSVYVLFYSFSEYQLKHLPGLLKKQILYILLLVLFHGHVDDDKKNSPYNFSTYNLNKPAHKNEV